jgi:Protein of unknown function (DUF2946)
MIWVRSNIRGVAWLALFALAMQLVLSFGHTHRGDFGLTSAVAAGADQNHVGSPSPAPADRDRGSTSDDGCAICASIALAGTLILTPPPGLAPPMRVKRVRFALVQADIPRGPARISFQARGPPVI